MIGVRPLGSTQPAMDFVVAETLKSMPDLAGIPADEACEVIRPRERHVTAASSIGSLGLHTHGDMESTSDRYVLAIRESMSGYMLKGLLTDVNEWLEDLARRIQVTDLILRLDCEDGQTVLDDAARLASLWVRPSWSRDGGAHLPSEVERACDWRYDYVPTYFDEDKGAFAELLVNLVPGGNPALRELDELMGRKLPPYEEQATALEDSFSRVAETMAARDEGRLKRMDDE